MDLDFSMVLDQLESMLNTLIARLPGVIAGLVVFFAFLYGARGARALVHRLTVSRHRSESLGRALGRIALWGIVVLGALVATLIAFPGFSVGQMVQLLGIGGLAFGIIFRDIFEDFFAGILLLLQQPFQIGDQIIVDEYEGTIEDIETRATTIRTYDGRRVYVPNADLFTQIVTVNTAYPHRRIEYDIGIGYSDDIALAQRLTLEALSDIDGILTEPAPEVLVVGLADSSVTLRARWWITPPRRADAMDSRDRVLAAVKDRLIAQGIDLPFPTQQILLHDQTEVTDGDRRRQREGWPAGPGDVPAPRHAAVATDQSPAGSFSAERETGRPTGPGHSRRGTD